MVATAVIGVVSAAMGLAINSLKLSKEIENTYKTDVVIEEKKASIDKKEKSKD